MSNTVGSSTRFSLHIRTALIGSPTYLPSPNPTVVTNPFRLMSRQGMIRERSIFKDPRNSGPAGCRCRGSFRGGTGPRRRDQFPPPRRNRARAERSRSRRQRCRTRNDSCGGNRTPAPYRCPPGAGAVCAPQWYSSPCAAPSGSPEYIPGQPVAVVLASFGVELGPEDAISPRHRVEIAPGPSGRDHVVSAVALVMIAVEEIEPLRHIDARQERVRFVHLNGIPAHVRHLRALRNIFRVKSAHLAGNEAHALQASFFAGIGEHVHSHTDAKTGYGPVFKAHAHSVGHAGCPESRHSTIESADARKENFRRRCELPRMRDNLIRNVRQLHERGNRIDIARAVVEDADHRLSVRSLPIRWRNLPPISNNFSCDL